MKLIQRPPSAAEIIKQTNFGTAVGISRNVKRGQEAVRKALHRDFTIRNKWAEIGPYAIKIKTAKASDLAGVIWTNAGWLEPHEKGGTKIPKGKSVAVPTWQLRPKGSTKILRTQIRPKALLASGKAFILNTPKGRVIARLKGKGQRLEILYGLEPRVRLKRTSTFYDPIENQVRRFLNHDIQQGIRGAFANALHKGKWK